MKPIHLKYSERYSHKFWEKINSIKGKKGEEAYRLGCILQNIESDIIYHINMLLQKP